MDENNVNNLIKQYMSDSQYGVTKIPTHLHNGSDTNRIDIKDIARFPSTPTNGQTVIFNSTTNQWEATAGSSSVNARSYGNGTTIPNTSETKLTLASSSFANGVTWDSGNNRLTILTAGQYLVTAYIQFAGGGGAVAGKLFQIRLKKSGSEINLVQVQGTVDNTAISVSTTDIVDCAVGAYFEIFAWQNSGVNKYIANNSETCYLSIVKV